VGYPLRRIGHPSILQTLRWQVCHLSKGEDGVGWSKELHRLVRQTGEEGEVELRVHSSV